MNGHVMRTYIIYHYAMPRSDLSNTENVYLLVFILYVLLVFGTHIKNTGCPRTNYWQTVGFVFLHSAIKLF